MTVKKDIRDFDYVIECWQAVWDALFEDVDMPAFLNMPQCEDLNGKELALERVKQLRNKLAITRIDFLEANERLRCIKRGLCGQGLQVAGWHQNGDLEPLDSWFEENEWGPVGEDDD